MLSFRSVQALNENKLNFMIIRLSAPRPRGNKTSKMPMAASVGPRGPPRSSLPSASFFKAKFDETKIHRWPSHRVAKGALLLAHQDVENLSGEEIVLPY